VQGKVLNTPHGRVGYAPRKMLGYTLRAIAKPSVRGGLTECLVVFGPIHRYTSYSNGLIEAEGSNQPFSNFNDFAITLVIHGL